MSAPTIARPTKVVIPVRLSYANIWEPRSLNGGPEKFSASLIVDKKDKATIARIEAAIAAAVEDGVERHGASFKAKGLRMPLRDGDLERDDEAYTGAMFMNANSKNAPQIVDARVQPILDRSEVYSGCYVNVSVDFYPYNTNGNRGIAAGLGNIQKVRDGEPLGGRSRVEDDFGVIESDDSFLS